MFIGEHPLTLDDRGRIAVPSKFRDPIKENAGGVMVATVSVMGPDASATERCIAVYPLPEWKRIASELKRLPSANPEVRAVNRLLAGKGTYCEMDGHGRILIAPPLRKFAGLDAENRKVMVVGQVDKFEVWREDHWNEYEQGLLENIGALSSDPQGVLGSLVL